LGKDARRASIDAGQKKGSIDARRVKEGFGVDESSLGGKKEGRRNEKGPSKEKRRTYSRRP